jgi:UDP-glucuronate 4-epimerase
MIVLVTGAAGFIGSHVCEQFLEIGFSVIGLDNFDSFYSKEIKQQNLAELYNKSGFDFYEADIRNGIILNKIFKSYPVDVVVHLAAKAGVRPSIDSISDYYDVNVNGTVSLLEAMRLNNVKKMIFASSSSVYGNNSKLPFSEEDFVDNPISPYASTKKSGELLCHVYSHLYGFDITCLRFFTVFGPRQRPDLAIHKFTKLIDESKPIPFYGDGSTARDYTFISDITNGIKCALNNLKGYRLYNLGESRVVYLSELVGMIEKYLGKKAIINHLPLQSGDVNITYADISRAKHEIGYDPKFSFEQGVEEFIKWYSVIKK